MSLELLEKLEELIGTLVLESQKLTDENRRLTEQVQSLSNELLKLRSHGAQLEKELALLNNLKSENRKIKFQKDEVRSRVQRILEKIKEMDIL